MEVPVKIVMWKEEHDLWLAAKQKVEEELGGTITDEQFANMMVKAHIRIICGVCP